MSCSNLCSNFLKNYSCTKTLSKNDMRTLSSKKQILVVEDEQAIRDLIRLTLESANFSVLEAEDARQAEYLIADRLPDLILLDWMLPSMSGVELAKHLKRDKITRGVSIILLTAKAEEENKILGLEVGADDYIIKPFSPRELVARIRAVLRRGPLEHPDGTITVKEQMA